MKLYYLLFLLLCLFTFAGCVKDESLKIVSIDIDESTLPEEVFIDEFDLSMLTLKVTMSDDLVYDHSILENMISDSDLTKLTQAGEHEIEVIFEGITTFFTINLIERVEILEVTFVNETGGIVLKVEVNKGDSLINIPEVPFKEGYIGSWDVQDFTNITSNLVVNPVYKYNEEININDITNQLDLTYTDLFVQEDVSLITDIKGVEINWSSSDITLLSNNGIFKRPYKSTVVEMTAEINFEDDVITREYNFTLDGYRSLNEGIASGYVYRSYNLLSEEFFETMDIIYCAFVLIDVNGGFTGPASNGNSVSYTNNNFLGNMTTHVIPKSKEKGIYAIASLGGGGTVPRETFSIIAASDALRKKFAENTVKLINDHGFDGVDIDWETPTAAEKENFTLLMNEIYTAVKANNINHLVTAAITGGMWQPPRYDLPNSIEYLDFVNVMTYGMTSDSGYYQNALHPSSTYNNSTLGVGRTLNSCSIEESVTVFNNLNVPSSKLIFGLAFYGMKQTRSGSTWSSGGSIHYTTIKKTILTSSDYIYVYDEKAQVPYIISKDGNTFISYDDPTSILAKSKYVFDNNLAGLMFWEHGTDLTGDLVHAMNQGLKQTNS